MVERVKKRALCVGINQYKNYPDRSLCGCVNDADQMRTILMDFLDFDESEIVTLIDEQATKAAISAELRSMVHGANQGLYNSLIYCHSGHGTQMLNEFEPDGMDEAFCPHDLEKAGNRWHAEHIIVDNEYHDLFSTLDRKVHLEVFLDTCHSGTGLRLIDRSDERRPRYMPPPTRIVHKKEWERRETPNTYHSMNPDNLTQIILWAACKAEQTSNDAKIDGDYHGVFTYYLRKSIDEQGGLLPREKILEKVDDYLKSYRQEPQLELNPLEIEIQRGY